MDAVPLLVDRNHVDPEKDETSREMIISEGDLVKMCVSNTGSCLASDDISIKIQHGLDLSSNIEACNEISPERVKSLIGKVESEDAVDLTTKKTEKEKRKSASAKKPPKPPRPPRGLSLDAADQKLIKEIAELAMRKRARIERMKALKKMKAAKVSSSSGNLFAMLFTLIFCLVILFQGMPSRRSTGLSSLASPGSRGTTEGGLSMVDDQGHPSAVQTGIPASRPFQG